MMKEKYEELKNLKGMMFQTSKGIYWLGLGTFAEANEEEKSWFDGYRSEIEKIHNLSYTPDEREIPALKEYLKKIISQSEKDFVDDNIVKAKKELEEFMETLSETDKESLREQKKDFIEALDYLDGCFYRHLKQKQAD